MFNKKNEEKKEKKYRKGTHPNSLKNLLSRGFKKGHIPWNKGKRKSGMSGKKHSEETKKKLSEIKKRQKQSLEHRRKVSEAMKGEKNPSWKGGKSRNKHTGWKYKQWRMAVFMRDNWTCQFCGARSKAGEPVYLEAHHNKSWANYPKLRYNVGNGITLCEECHTLANKIQRQYEKRRKKTSL